MAATTVPGVFANLRENPEAEVAPKGAAEQRMRARTASPLERARLWPLVIADHQNDAADQARTSRQIPLASREPVA